MGPNFIFLLVMVMGAARAFLTLAGFTAPLGLAGVGLTGLGLIGPGVTGPGTGITGPGVNGPKPPLAFPIIFAQIHVSPGARTSLAVTGFDGLTSKGSVKI